MSSYAEKLLADTALLDEWPQRIVTMQRNWIGNKVDGYHLHDWCISRQRYWGAPMPFIICPACGIQPVPDSQLPILLPANIDITPGWPPPLARVESFVKTACPVCGGSAERATDVMDTFVFSAWYYLRFVDPHNDSTIFNRQKETFWSPVDLYVGGVEHATVHLIYARFFHKVLFDLGLVSNPEPFKRLFTQGMVCLGGEKMSKSKGNIISPVDIVEKYGADTLRTFILFVGPPEQDVDWSDQGIRGCHRFLNRVFTIVTDFQRRFVRDWRSTMQEVQFTESDIAFRIKIHQCIKKTTDILEKDFRFNVMIASLMEFINDWEQYVNNIAHDLILSEAIETFLLLIYPITPHLAEELWQQLGFLESICRQNWPQAEPALTIEDTVKIVVQINGKKKGVIMVARASSEEDIIRAAQAEASTRGFSITEIRKTFFIPGKVVNFTTADCTKEAP